MTSERWSDRRDRRSAISICKSFKLLAMCLLILISCDDYFPTSHKVNSGKANAATNSDANSWLGGGSDSQSMFYIYEWPAYMDDVWPPQNASLHAKSGYDHGFYANRGAGKGIAPDVGLFQTWQFSLYRNLMARLRTSEFRTKDPSKATAFIIPFDLGVHSYIDHLDGHPRLAAPHGRFAGRYLRQNCQGATKDLWWKNKGHDHFLIFSITAYQMVGMQVKELFMFVCQNCTVITIETSPTGTAPPGRTRKHWFAAPYPSSFHYHEGIKELPWELPGTPPPVVNPPTQTGLTGVRQLQALSPLSSSLSSLEASDRSISRSSSSSMKDERNERNERDERDERNRVNGRGSISLGSSSSSSSSEREAVGGSAGGVAGRSLVSSGGTSGSDVVSGGDTKWSGSRDILSLFIGSVKTAQASSRALRTALYDQCKAEGSPSCEWRSTPHSCNGVVNASDSMLLFRRSVFCPAPAGDSLTRKSLFDSLVAGCIPVLFSRASLTQYKWHLSQSDVDDVAVYIPMSRINDEGANFITILKGIPGDEVMRKQAAIRRVAPSLQYSIVPAYVDESKGHIWTPPFRDAASVIIEKILDTETIQPIGGYTYEDLKRLNLEQKHLSETHEDYATMRTKEKKGSKVRSAKEVEDAFLDRAITKISYVCEGTNAFAWGPQQPREKKDKVSHTVSDKVKVKQEMRM